ncbi:acyl-CoA dehydrogenase family protein [Falsiroseomonas sp. HW251]|uniref:acyl-CoA dehydrogenase family protein n=1 Tax=Falsiroseomonas sp. HW251 TaxID=3390998 RepID=UPI003D31A329
MSMTLSLTTEERAFTAEVRDFVRAKLPDHIRARCAKGLAPHTPDLRIWQRLLQERGWGAPSWKMEHGGTGWSLRQRLLFQRELDLAPAPSPHTLNIGLVGPVIAEFGTKAQQDFFLPKLLRLDIAFCQGFSEPGAGSDLAAVRTSAVRDGDDYVVQGQKIWTSFATESDWIFCLVRTDPNAAKPQLGISFLLVDMATPGVTVRPIRTIDSQQHVNEVFFDQVRVPAANLVGDENKGWDYAKYLLVNERVGIARTGRARERLRRARALAAEVMQDGRSLIEAASWRRRIAELEAQLVALEMTELRLASTPAGDAKAMDTLGAILKLRGSEILQSCVETLAEVAGLSGLRDGMKGNEPDDIPDWGATAGSSYFYSRAQSIFGGTSEIQRNIIAKASLGLR